MTNYIPKTNSYPTGLDELGLRIGLNRLEDETEVEYRQRLLLQLRRPPGASQVDYIASVGRTVGLLDELIWSIDLVLEDDVPIASDPRIEITSSRFKVWSDYSNSILELDLDIYHRSGNYFLIDVYNVLSALDFISISTITTEDVDYWSSSKLMISNSDGYVNNERLKSSKLNQLEYNYINQALFSASHIFNTEVANADLVLNPGDYYIDKTNGRVFSFDIASSVISYSYRAFPFMIYWQPVRVYALNDADIKERLYSELVNTSGELEYSLLNERGAFIYNQVLKQHPLQWGK